MGGMAFKPGRHTRALFRDVVNPLTDPLHIEGRRSLRLGRRRVVPEFSPGTIRAIRTLYNMKRTEFARMIGINAETLRNWETGRRCPQGPARALLRIAAANPEAVARVLKEHRQFDMADRDG